MRLVSCDPIDRAGQVTRRHKTARAPTLSLQVSQAERVNNGELCRNSDSTKTFQHSRREWTGLTNFATAV